LGAREAIQRANLGLALTAKLPERAKLPLLFRHSKTENVSASGDGASPPDTLTRGSSPGARWGFAPSPPV